MRLQLKLVMILKNFAIMNNMRFQKECVVETTDSKIKFEEKKKVVIFNNPQRKTCLKVQVDGCVIKSTQETKCDNLLVEDNGNEHFVELKGTDVAHALKQLDGTILKLTDKTNKTKKVFAYIVCTNMAPQISGLIQKMKAKFCAQYKAKLEIRERRLETKIS